MLLDVKDLRIAFGKGASALQVVRGVSFAIDAGETLCLVGESGCGKSLTARAILDILDRPGHVAGGEIHWRSKDDGALHDLVRTHHGRSAMRAVRGREIAMIFQEPMAALSPVHTIGEQLTEGLRLHMGLSKAAARDRAIQLLGRVGIPRPETRLDQYSFQFSGGMRQRAMIAIALACNPRLLIADEPTTALDVTTQAQVLELLRDLQAEFGMAILFITHDLGVVAEIADRVAVMYAGQIVESGGVHEIFANPRHPYTRALLASVPSPDDDSATRLETIEGSVPLPHEVPPGCLFAPRCKMRVDAVCTTTLPGTTLIGDAHQVRCFRATEVAG